MEKENYKIILNDLIPGTGIVDYAYRNKGVGKTENKNKVVNRIRGLFALNIIYATSLGMLIYEGASQLEKIIN